MRVRAAALVLMVSGATVALAAPAQAATPTQVALIVRYPGGATTTWCVTYRAGMTGADVLAPAGPTYGTGPYAGGFVLRIGGQGTVPPTPTTYWHYWRSTAGTGSFVSSDAGLTSTRPPAGSVEAWTWDAGSESSFPHDSYATVCPGGFATPATTAAAPAPAPSGGPGPTVGRTAGTSPGGSTGAAGSSGATSGGAHDTTPASSSPTSADPGGSTASGTSSASGATGSPSGSASPTADRVIDASPAAMSTTGGGHGATSGVVVGIVAVGTIAAVAVRHRRRRAGEN